MPNFKSRGWAEISKTRSKKNPFKVRYFGKNGESLSTSEPLATMNNCKKNIIAHGKQWEGNDCFPSINVLDKSVKLPMWYELSIDGEMITAGGE